MTPEHAAMLTQLLAQLESRATADAAAFVAFQGLVDRRFESAHEDRRRDFRDLLGELREVRAEMARRFDANDDKLAVLCDQSGLEHQRIKDEVNTRVDRVVEDLGAVSEEVLELRHVWAANENQAIGETRARGRIAGAGKWAVTNGWFIAFVLYFASTELPRFMQMAAASPEGPTIAVPRAAP